MKLKKNHYLCTKTYYTHMPSDVLIDNNIDPTGLESNYPLFQEGKSYKIIGPVNTICGRTIVYVDSNIKTKHNNMFIHQTFHVQEFDDKKIQEWEIRMNSESTAKMKSFLSEKDFAYITEKPRNEKFILDYFDYKINNND